MLEKDKNKIYKFLRWTEKWTKTDMVYLVSGGFWFTLSKIIAIVFGFAMSIAFANLIPKETFGTYKYILSIGGILGIATLTGMETAVVQSVARSKEGSAIEGLKTRIKYGFLGGVGGVLLAGYYFMSNNVTLGCGLLIISFLVPFAMPSAMFSSLLSGRKKFKLLSKFNITINLITVLSLIVTISLTKNIYWILFIHYFIFLLLRYISFWLIVRKEKLNGSKSGGMVSYGKHLSVMGALNTVAFNMDQIVIWNILGPVQLAIYSFALAPTTHFRDLLKPLNSLALPKLANGDIKLIKKTLLNKVFKLVVILSIPVIIFIIIAPHFYNLFFPQYIEAARYASYSVLILFFIPFNLFETALLARREKRKLYIVRVSSSVIRIILLILLLPLLGVFGAVLALIIGAATKALLLYYYFKKF